ncbi:MAG: hypothetical protein IH994_01275 [Proteobacteria bacterium]|nr:hypothetical protein [Pseudomonadota bacterium]
MAKFKTSIDEFEAWCVEPVVPADIKGFGSASIFKPYKAAGDPEGKTKTIEEILQLGNSPQPVNMNLRPFGGTSSLDLSFSQSPKTNKISKSAIPNYWELNVSEFSPFSLSGAGIRSLILETANRDTTISDCFIGTLNVVGIHNNLILNDCLVGTLMLGHGVLGDFTVTGGTIRSVICPAPDSENPFTGSVTFTEVKWPTRHSASKLFKGPQQYRNLRAHMRKLENVPEASRMRALELASEQETDTGTNFVVSWLYGAISDYGRAAARPFLLAVGLYLLMSVTSFWGEAVVLGLKENSGVYVGWRSGLVGPELSAEKARAFFLPLQSMINPGGIFSARTLVTAANGWWQTATVIQGLVCDLFLAMSIFAIRKRFKVQ